LNNLIEQDHRAIKRIIRPMLGFKSLRLAGITLQGIELMHRIKKGQKVSGNNQNLSAAGQFYSSAA
jgi:putative transposase